MKRSLYLYVSVLTILIVGSCGLMEKDVADMDPKDLPDVRAFQDDFTREFMASPEPVEGGYYEFESKTGGYTMKYPENALMSKKSYERTKDTFERIRYAEDPDNDGVSYNVVATYDHSHSPQDLDSLLYLLSSSVSYEGEFEEIEHEDNSIYFATMKRTTKSKPSTWYKYFGLIKSEKSNQSLRYIYTVKCVEPGGDCSYDRGAIEEKVKEIMESVEFRDVELEGENN